MPSVHQHICNYLNAQSISYEVVGTQNEYIAVRQKIPGTTSVVNVIVMTDAEDIYNKHIQIKIYNLCNIPNVTTTVWKTLNEINESYRWFRAYLDSDNDVILTADAIVDITDPGDEVFELMLRGVKICEYIYPILMKAAWA